MTWMKTVGAFLLAGLTLVAQAQDFVGRKEGSYEVKGFKFSTGEVMDVKLHYTTLGDPKNEAVLILHGTTGSGAGMLGAPFGGQLFGPGQPLDASKYYVILPDAIGTGKSTKPSDGLRAKFPQYNYDDMVNGQPRDRGSRHHRASQVVEAGPDRRAGQRAAFE
jgi:homoserine O-acetyltransferase